jgi:hypothetical protein
MMAGLRISGVWIILFLMVIVYHLNYFLARLTGLTDLVNALTAAGAKTSTNNHNVELFVG